MICRPMSRSIWATLAACWCWTRRASQEGAEVGRGAAAVQRHGGSDRELPGRGVPRLRQPLWPSADRPGPLSAGELGRGPDAGPQTGIPEAVGFVTKPKLGLAMLERAHAAGLPFAWVTADSVYGADHSLRRWLQEKGLGYVLAVSRTQRLGFDRVEDHAGEVPPDGLASPERRRRGQGPAALRLGLRSLRQRCGARLGEGPPDPPQPRRPRRARLLPHPRPPRHRPCRTRAGGRQPLDDRGLLRGGQGRGRPRPVRGPLLDRLASPRRAIRSARKRIISASPCWIRSGARGFSMQRAKRSGSSSGVTGRGETVHHSP